MKDFDYSLLQAKKWDSDLLNYVGQIAEHKGRQELFLSQKPAVLDSLVELAIVQSTESSNRIEGIRTSDSRLKDLVLKKVTPQDRDEEEILGYQDVLSTIHESYQYIAITPQVILQLHRDLFKYSERSIGGRFKNTQNYISETSGDGATFVRFTPLDPFSTPAAMTEICDAFNRAIDADVLHPLILIPVFIHDFLCIHPFNDGNGRMSRLLTTLLLYKSGYVVGRYISLEEKIERTKMAYYKALEESGHGWHEGQDDPSPFIRYILATVLAAYRDFEDRVNLFEPAESALDQVRRVVNRRVGKFTKRDIMEIIPMIGRASIENSLTALVEEGLLERHGKGRGTFYTRK